MDTHLIHPFLYLLPKYSGATFFYTITQATVFDGLAQEMWQMYRGLNFMIPLVLHTKLRSD